MNIHIAAIAIATALAACDDPIVVETPDPVSAVINRQLDVLFVIDDSFSMAAAQQSLAQSFRSFESELGRLGVKTDVRIGVTSTNMGARDGLSGCDGNGDDGQLLGGDCTSDGEAVLTESNAVESLSETFACMADLGTGGCGFEAPLEAARRALDTSALLRDDAALLVVLVTNEDDCSISDRPTFFGGGAVISSFRCFETGVRCEPDDPSAFGERGSCSPRELSRSITPIGDFADYFAALKPGGRFALTSIHGVPAITQAGYAATVRPDPNPGSLNGQPQLAPSCTSAAGEAAPAIRISSLLDAFPISAEASICESDLSAPLASFARLAGEPLSIACVPSELTCAVTVESAADFRTAAECSSIDETGCYERLRFATSCDGAGLRYRTSELDPAGATIRVECE